MKWILTHALPPAALSQALEQALLGAQTEMPARLEQLFGPLRATSQPCPVMEYGCTPEQWLVLQTQGYPVRPHDPERARIPGSDRLPIGSAYAAFEHRIREETQPVWIAQACATLISAERATLLPLSELQATDADLQALHEAIAPILGAPGDPVQIERLSPGNWRVRGDLPSDAWLASPDAVRGQDLGDWWPTEDGWRPWRRVLNEIQMCWHDHPVNERRLADGLPAINGVWLYGGAPGWTPNPVSDVHWITDLSEPARQGEWTDWIASYTRIVEQLLQEVPLASDTPGENGQTSFEIILTGENRIVTLEPGASALARVSDPTPAGGFTRVVHTLRTALSRLQPGARRANATPPGQVAPDHHPQQSWSHWWNNA